MYASNSLRMEGEAIKESVACGREQRIDGEFPSMSMSRMIKPEAMPF